MHVRLLTATALVATMLGGCSAADGGAGTAEPDGGQPLAIVATTPEVADFTRVLGGDHVIVTQVIKPGVDPHDYEPAPSDLQAIGSAKMVVKNGVGLERWLDSTIAASGFDGTVVDASQGVQLRPGDPGDPDTALGDPHVWHNPQNAKIMVINIQSALARIDPDNSVTYQQNLNAYVRKLDELDAANVEKLKTIPAARRKLVTNHDAFGYYVDRYKLEFVGSVIPSLDTSADLSARQIDDLVRKIRSTGVKAIFTESSLPPKTARSIAERAGVTVVAGDDALFGDSLGPPGTPGGTYLGAEQHNTDAIVAALQGPR